MPKLGVTRRYIPRKSPCSNVVMAPMEGSLPTSRVFSEIGFFDQTGIEVVAPHRNNRKNKRQDGRRLRRYRRRWKIERLFAWLQNFRRLVVRYERYAENFLGMLHLGCCLILLRNL